MNDLTFKHFREVNHARATEWNGDTPWSPADRLVEFVGELGEACNIMKKLKRHECKMPPHKDQPEDEYQQAKIDYVEHLKTEIADVVICIDLLADELGIDLEEVTRAKFNHTSKKHGFPHRL